MEYLVGQKHLENELSFIECHTNTPSTKITQFWSEAGAFLYLRDGGSSLMKLQGKQESCPVYS